ncbi:AraC family transcriptional regulator [Phyllobacterium endophyticum]|uniref:AraC family transcriptional regulator n=1 Tax=Phyllobacterium endophyticum TaxID=1149773 RepID=UPI001802E163|nr:AraC family transcriptional regulator [Phyllobacterium endophyticum]MBB3237008.1 AraC-like DNA-binding protein [Phyllobacterium endophyticum]
MTSQSRPDEVRRSVHQTLVHHFIDWGMVRAQIVKRTGLARQETHIARDQHSFLINLKGGARFGEDFVEGRSIGFTPRRPGSIVFVPAHREWTGWDEGDAIGSYLFVSIDTTFINQCIDSRHLVGLKPAIGFRDVMIEYSLQRIATELNNPDPISVSMAKSQAVQLFVQLLRLNGVGLEPVKGGLSPHNLKRINAMIESRPANPPSVDELIRESGVSRRHFFRAFKQSTGKTPHSYVLRHQLKFAVNLLRATDLSATEIALECGFSSSSHFTIAFKQAFGAAPSQFRKGWRC